MKIVKESYYPLENGKKLLAREEFNGDKRDGLIEKWNEDGCLKSRISYKDGRKVLSHKGK